MNHRSTGSSPASGLRSGSRRRGRDRCIRPEATFGDNLIMATHTLLIYIPAAFGLSLTPGPNSLLVLTHGALYGHRRTWLTVWAARWAFAADRAVDGGHWCAAEGVGACADCAQTDRWRLPDLAGHPALALAAGDGGSGRACAQTSGSAMFRQGLLDRHL